MHINKDAVNVEELLSGFIDEGSRYYLSDAFDEECVIVDKNTLEVFNRGYIGMLSEWIDKGYIISDEEYEKRNASHEVDSIVFPHTIGNRIFYSSEELISYVLYCQGKLFMEDK